MNVFIRAATPQDVPNIRKLLIETWHHTYDATMGVAKVNEITDNWHSLERLEAQALSTDVFLIAEQDSALLGTSLASRDDDGVVWLRRLYVTPPAQGLGIGQRLLEETLRQLPLRAVRLEVEPENHKAIRFYERAGFLMRNRQSSCGDQPLPALLMEMARP